MPDNLKAKSVNPKPGELSAQQKMNYGFGIPRWSPYAPTGYRVSKGSESHEYGSYTKHDYLIKLAAYLRELAIQSGEDLKMQPAPVHESKCRDASDATPAQVHPTHWLIYAQARPILQELERSGREGETRKGERGGHGAPVAGGVT